MVRQSVLRCVLVAVLVGSLLIWMVSPAAAGGPVGGGGGTGSQVNETLTAGAIVLIAAAVVAGGYFLYRGLHHGGTGPEGEKPTAVQSRRLIVILPLENTSPEAEGGDLATHIAETISAAVRESKGLLLAEPAKVQSALAQIRIGPEEIPLAVGRRLGAKAVLEGTVSQFGALTELRLSISETASGAVRSEYAAWANDEDMKENIGRIVRSLAEE